MDNKTIDLKIAELNRIKEQNALYKKLSPAERRVEVAKDALFHVQKGFWKPLTENGYVNLDKHIKVESDMCSWHPGKTDCEVCARGALFLGAVNKFNSWNPKDNLDEARYGGSFYEIVAEDFGNVEEKLWSKRQIAEIEYVFELDDLGEAGCHDWTEYDMDVVKKWGKQYKAPKDRLIAILKNIVRNKGTFKMDDKFDIK